MAEYINRDAFLSSVNKRYCEDCLRRKGVKNGKYQVLYEIGGAACRACWVADMIDEVYDFSAADVVSASEFRDCRNELCMRCGNYTQAHKGACDGCRWKEWFNWTNLRHC